MTMMAVQNLALPIFSIMIYNPRTLHESCMFHYALAKHAVGLDIGGIFSIIFLKDKFSKKLFKISKLFLEKRK